MDTIQLQEIIFNNELRTNGGGFFAKVGAIFVPAPWLRLGLSLHSGSRLNLSDSYNSDITAKYNNGSLTSESPQGGFDYTIRTPGKINVSMALLSSKIGMLSADYEIADFRNSRLIPNSTFSDINQNISNVFALNQTIRVGGEIRLTPNYLIRMGYSNSSSPYKNLSNSLSYNRYTGGIGYREDWFFVDLAFALTSFSENYFLYNPSFVDAANLKNINKNFITSVGFRF
jgi:long-subunit fatty acid transport protein